MIRSGTNHAKRYHWGVFGGVGEMVAKCGEFYAAKNGQGSIYRVGQRNMEGSEPTLPRGFFRDWPDVAEAVQTPWLRGVKTVNMMAADLMKQAMPEPTAPRRKSRWSDDDGDEVDNDRLRAGAPFWRQSYRQVTRAPRTITVAVNVSTAWDVRPEEILWRGAAAVALTKILESLGFGVELWAFNNVSSGFEVSHYGWFSALKLKAAGSPLNLSSVACGISGWFFRTAFFWCYHVAPERPASHLGFPIHRLEEWQLDMIAPDADPVVIANCWSYDSALASARAWLGRIKGEVKDRVLEYSPRPARAGW